MGLTRALQPTY